MTRFRPYLRYLVPVRGPLAFAIFCGLLYGAASGAGLREGLSWLVEAAKKAPRRHAVAAPRGGRR